MRRYVKLTLSMLVIGAVANVAVAWRFAWWWQGIEGKSGGPAPLVGPGMPEDYAWFKAHGWYLGDRQGGMIEKTMALGYARTAVVVMPLDEKGRPKGGVGWAGVR